MTDRNVRAGLLIDYLQSQAHRRVPARELCRHLGLAYGDTRTLRTLVALARRTTTINSSTTPGNSGYWVGAPDTRQLEAHAISELAACRAVKKYHGKTVQGELEL